MLRRSPSIGAAPGSNTGTRRFAIVDNDPAHLVDPRRSSGERSDPLPSPRQYPSLAGDDDGREPSDPSLIVRPGIAHTVSGFITR